MSCAWVPWLVRGSWSRRGSRAAVLSPSSAGLGNPTISFPDASFSLLLMCERPTRGGS